MSCVCEKIPHTPCKRSKAATGWVRQNASHTWRWLSSSHARRGRVHPPRRGGMHGLAIKVYETIISIYKAMVYRMGPPLRVARQRPTNGTRSFVRNVSFLGRGGAQ
jgi:hypothetical protein